LIRIVSALAASSTLLVASHALAYVPYTTRTGEPYRWWSDSLTFHLATTAPEEVDAAALPEVLHDLFDQWITLPCGVVPEVVLGGAREAPAIVEPGANERDNLMVFVRTRSEWQRLGRAHSELAITQISVDPETGEIVDADIFINDASHVFTLDDAPAEGAISLRVVLLHELGHFYGLDHSLAPDAVMAEAYDPERTTLTADDAAGACALYADVPSRAEPSTPSDAGCSGSSAPLGIGLVPLALLALRRRAGRAPSW